MDYDITVMDYDITVMNYDIMSNIIVNIRVINDIIPQAMISYPKL